MFKAYARTREDLLAQKLRDDKNLRIVSIKRGVHPVKVAPNRTELKRMAIIGLVKK